MNALAQMGFGDLDHELQMTRKMLERVPMERGEWKAHEKSFSVGATATHVANLVWWMHGMLLDNEYDLATAGKRDSVATTEALLAEFDDHVLKLKEIFARTSPEAMMEPWTLRIGDHVIFTMTRGAVIRSMGINHIVHHRAQLSVYLRMMDVPVPGMYGPSADDPR